MEQESLCAWGAGGKRAHPLCPPPPLPPPPGVLGLAAAPTQRRSPRFFRTMSTPHPGECQGLQKMSPSSSSSSLGRGRKVWGATPRRDWQPGSPPRGSGKLVKCGCFSAQSLSAGRTWKSASGSLRVSARYFTRSFRLSFLLDGFGYL